MTLLKLLVASIATTLLPVSVAAGKLATIEVTLASPTELYTPVSVALDSLVAGSEEHLVLRHISADRAEVVPYQIYSPENGQGRQLVWLVSAAGKSTTHIYELSNQKNAVNEVGVQSKASNGLLVLSSGGKNLLGYQYGFMPAPEGVDPAYGRSGFIHPLWSPDGQVLTQIQPADHYHHYGIWNPWTHILFEGREVDLWNLAKKQGTVRFANFVSQSEGPVFGEFQALHEHVVFGNESDEKGVEKIALKEIQTVRVYRPHDHYYIMDMTVALAPATSTEVKFLEYRYGGFGWRATDAWDKHNSEMLSSEGKTRINIDNTRGRWFLVQGDGGNGFAGAAVMSSPQNFNHPEPLRMWGLPEDPADRGDVFACFSPTRDRDWLLEPGKTYTQQYRFVVYKGKMSAKTVEGGWQVFAERPAVKIRKHK